jgi:hypothetical protein
MVARGARRVGPSGAGDARPFPGMSLPRLLGTAQWLTSRSRRERVGPVAYYWGCLGRGFSSLGARGLGFGAPEHERRPSCCGGQPRHDKPVEVRAGAGPRR